MGRLSFSGKSRKGSNSSIPKVNAAETAREKHAFQINTKADPSKAVNEAQPSSFQVLEGTTMESISKFQHRDVEGNVITDPDRSNPTRTRLERPLETIRSFEAAIDGSYTRRSSLKAESAGPTNAQNRRSSYGPGHHPQRRSPVEGGAFHGNRMSSSRPESYAESYATPPSQYYNGRRFGPRNNSDPALYGNNVNQGVYPEHGQQQSYDTVASASNGSYATDPLGNSTDPSSENSSIDKVQTAPKPDMGEAYGFNGFGGAPKFPGPILEEHGQGAPAYGQPGYGQSRQAQPQAASSNSHPYQGNGASNMPLPTPPKDNGPRVPIKLGGGSPSSARLSRTPPSAENEKRKSWLKKRFSRGSMS